MFARRAASRWPRAGKLGAVLFQFPQWFAASRGNVAYLREVAERSAGPPAIEFRGGGWMEEERAGAHARHCCESSASTYVVVDEPQGFKIVGAARGRGDLAGPRDDPLPRPQRRELGEARA